MPYTLTLNQIAEKNKQHTANRWVMLLVLRPPAGSVASTQYFAKSNSAVTYGGQSYTPINLSPGPIPESAEGDFPAISVSINNPAHILDSFIEDTDGCEGCEVDMFMVNTGHLADSPPNTYTWDIDTMKQNDDALTFVLGIPSALRRQIPTESYRSRNCQFSYSEDLPCNVTPFSINGITLSGTDPVEIIKTGHTFVTGDQVTTQDITDITPSSINGNFVVTVVDANTVSLDGTDSSDYSGTWSSGGTIKFRFCNGIILECIARNNITRHKAFPGLRSRTVRYL